MELSNINAEILFIDTHQNIEGYADSVVTKIFDEKKFDFLSYPPNCGFTELEKRELMKIEANEHLKNALRKILADNSASIVFRILNVIDGTGDPESKYEQWSGVKLIDDEANENSGPVDDFLHDKFYETFWDWKEIRPNKSWKLDTLE